APSPLPDDNTIGMYLIDGTRLLDRALVGPPDLAVAAARGQPVVKAWTGAAATTTQALAWPRTGMLTATGAPIAPTDVPQGVKDSVSEIVLASLPKTAGSAGTDLSATNAVAAAGLKSVTAGSVSVSFKDNVSAASFG